MFLIKIFPNYCVSREMAGWHRSRVGGAGVIVTNNTGHCLIIVIMWPTTNNTAAVTNKTSFNYSIYMNILKISD